MGSAQQSQQTIRDILTTAGSTNAVHPSSSSKSARTNDTAAEPSKMRTSWSLNCSRMSSQMGVGGSSGSAVTWSARVPSSSFPIQCMPRTISAMLVPQALHLRLRETAVLGHLEMFERLSGRPCIGILHAPIDALPQLVRVHARYSSECAIFPIYSKTTVYDARARWTEEKREVLVPRSRGCNDVWLFAECACM